MPDSLHAGLRDVLQEIATGFYATSGLELVAVIASLSYLILAMKENQWCWPLAFLGTSIYIFLFWRVFLFMDALLHVYYLAMAIYGWRAWQKRSAASTSEKSQDESQKNIQTWGAKKHLLAISAILVASVLTGYLLDAYTPAAWPYIDSFTSWGAVVTTYMVTQKVLENWLYWIVVDSVATVVYIERGLYFTAALFVAYVVIVIIGYFNWRTRLANQA